MMITLWIVSNSVSLQLCDTLFYENSNVDIELIDVENEGNCIKFSPLDTAQGLLYFLIR